MLMEPPGDSVERNVVPRGRLEAVE